MSNLGQKQRRKKTDIFLSDPQKMREYNGVIRVSQKTGEKRGYDTEEYAEKCFGVIAEWTPLKYRKTVKNSFFDKRGADFIIKYNGKEISIDVKSSQYGCQKFEHKKEIKGCKNCYSVFLSSTDSVLNGVKILLLLLAKNFLIPSDLLSMWQSRIEAAA